MATRERTLESPQHDRLLRVVDADAALHVQAVAVLGVLDPYRDGAVWQAHQRLEFGEDAAWFGDGFVRGDGVEDLMQEGLDLLVRQPVHEGAAVGGVCAVGNLDGDPTRERDALVEAEAELIHDPVRRAEQRERLNGWLNDGCGLVDYLVENFGWSFDCQCGHFRATSYWFITWV